MRNISTPGNIAYQPTSTSRLDISRSHASGDLDGDGKPDIALALEPENGLNIYRNISLPGKISFAGPQYYPAGFFPNGIAIRDLDSDGKPDIAVVNANSKTSLSASSSIIILLSLVMIMITTTATRLK